MKAHRRFTHRTFSTEKPLHRTIFTHVFLHKKHLTQRNLYTQIAYRSFYRPTLLHAETLPREQFLHNIFFRSEAFTQKKHMHSTFYRQTGFTCFTQKVLGTEGFTHNILTYRRFYTQMSLHRHQLHTETCAHSTRLHTANFYTERFCFPFLITYLLCSSSLMMVR